jgi:hypothetical protein
MPWTGIGVTNHLIGLLSYQPGEQSRLDSLHPVAHFRGRDGLLLKGYQSIE